MPALMPFDRPHPTLSQRERGKHKKLSRSQTARPWWIEGSALAFASRLRWTASQVLRAAVSMPRLAAPQLLQARVAPAVQSVVLVAHRVLLVVILVIALGGIERSGFHDLGDDGCLEWL